MSATLEDTTCCVDPFFINGKIKHFLQHPSGFIGFHSSADCSPQGPLVGIHPLKGRESESSSWAKQPTSSPATGAVIAKPVSCLPWLDAPVPLGFLQWERMGGEWMWAREWRIKSHFESHCRPDLLSSWGLEKCFWLAWSRAHSLWVAACPRYAGKAVSPLSSCLQMAGPELTAGPGTPFNCGS